MSKSFFTFLGIPKPDIDLEVGSGSHAEQTAKAMVGFEKICQEVKTDMGVVGDANSTLASTIVAKMLWIPVAQVEASLRSFDMKLPEEINRLGTDSTSDLFITTDPEANENLRKAGVEDSRIHFVGNVMIDSLLANRAASEKNPILEECRARKGEYGPLTIHTLFNMDDRDTFGRLVDAIGRIQERICVILQANPRTLSMISKLGFDDKVVGTSTQAILNAMNRILNGRWKKSAIPEGWDGRAGERLVATMEDFLGIPFAADKRIAMAA